MDISRIKITRVNGIYNYDIPIANNTLILVGENGTGKSTVLSILNLIISRETANKSCNLVLEPAFALTV